MLPPTPPKCSPSILCTPIFLVQWPCAVLPNVRRGPLLQQPPEEVCEWPVNISKPNFPNTFFSPHNGGEAVWEGVESLTALCSCSSVTTLFRWEPALAVSAAPWLPERQAPALHSLDLSFAEVFSSYIMFSTIRLPTTGQIPGLEEWQEQGRRVPWAYVAACWVAGGLGW